MVMGKRGETGTPDEPAKGCVWVSILDGWQTPGFENEYVSVADLDRSLLSKYPWSLQGGGAGQLKEKLESAATKKLRDVAPQD